MTAAIKYQYHERHQYLHFTDKETQKHINFPHNQILGLEIASLNIPATPCSPHRFSHYIQHRKAQHSSHKDKQLGDHAFLPAEYDPRSGLSAPHAHPWERGAGHPQAPQTSVGVCAEPIYRGSTVNRVSVLPQASPQLTQSRWQQEQQQDRQFDSSPAEGYKAPHRIQRL